VDPHETRATGDYVAGNLGIGQPFAGVRVIANDQKTIGARSEGPRDAVNDPLTTDDLEAFGQAAKPRRRSPGEYCAC
jgi:hypothetical protein